MAEKKEKAAVPPRAGRSPADPEEEDAPVILPTGVVVRRRRAADADDATPLPRRRTPARAPEEAPARDDADDEPIVLTSQGIRDPTERAVDDWTPAEAIAELDQLQRDLERLRRSRRPPDS